MRYLSVCSGIEAATVAWHSLGWTPAAFAEVEPFPSAVLAHHYPDVPNVGDMTKFKEWDIGAIDILVGGTPCQSFSIAGLRKGLDDARGNLALTYCQIADKFDPEWCVWENVPGVLSSKDNAFGCFLAGLVGADEPIDPNGKWSKSGVVSGPKRTAAWRILDAQYFGVAQRRRRVFVLAVRGSRNWRAAAALFPVGESMYGDSAPSREARESPTYDIAPCLTRSGRGVERTGDIRGQDPVVAVGYAPEVARCIATREGSSQDFETTTMVAAPVQRSMERPRGDGCDTLIAFDTTQITSPTNGSHPRQGDACHPLSATAHVPAIALGIPGNWIGRQPENGGNATEPMHDVAPCLTKTDQHGVQTGMAVRRLTPRECERLQGFPDDYTLVPNRGKPAADGPRYKALGNSMATVVMNWLGRRIEFARRM